MRKVFLTILFSLILLSNFNYAADGYKLWLKHKLVSDTHLLKVYRDLIKGVIVEGNSPTIQISPKMKLWILNHCDMLNGVHEYSGLLSIWDWQTLPEFIKPEFLDYARANASIGINAIVPNNVDADLRFLLPWKYKMISGNTLWDDLCYHYYKGVDGLAEVQRIWNSLKGKIDDEEFNSEQMLLKL